MSRPARVAPVELLRALAVLGEPPSGEHGAVAAAVGLGDPPDGHAYATVFVFNLYPYASVHMGPEGMLGGEARDRVAGFWRAVGRAPPAEPDHLSALLGLYVSLLEEAGDRDGPERTLSLRSAVALLHEHLAPWAPAFLERVARDAPGFYGRWAGLLEQTLRSELAWAGEPRALPAHLREAPPLPDPREGDAGAFLPALLAPVRSGMIVTRSDLARMARSLGLGARLGDRRRVLESLMAVEPEDVLRALADHAREAEAAHAAREPTLGPAASFWRDRCRRTARLLTELANEAHAGVRPGDLP
jgi:TorA maturation chaperone TorD